MPGTHDKAAAEKEFLEMFKNADSKVKGKLIKHFLRGFRRGYKLEGNVQKCWEQTLVCINEAENGPNQEYNAGYFGRALGSFLIGVERYTQDNGIFVDRYTNDLLTIAANIASTLKKSNKSVKPKFIKNRILVIARKNAGSLSAERQKFLAQVAALFI